MITKIYSKDKNPIRFRIMKYEIDNKYYYIGTTIFNHKIQYFKKLYHDRWCIETNFRESKYILSLVNLTSTKENELIQDIQIHGFISIIKSFINNFLKEYLPNNKKINSKIIIHALVNDIMYLSIYKLYTISIENKLVKILNTLLETSNFINKKDRHYDRIRIKPIGKWYYCNQYKIIYNKYY